MVSLLLFGLSGLGSSVIRPRRAGKLPSLQRFRIHFQEGGLSFGFFVPGIDWQPVMPSWTHAPQWLQNFLKDQLHSSPLSLSSIMVISNLSKNIRKFWCECSPEITELHNLLQKSLKSEFVTTGSVTFPPSPFASLVITFSILSYFKHHPHILPAFSPCSKLHSLCFKRLATHNC